MRKVLGFLTSRLFILFALIGIEAVFLITLAYYFTEQSPLINALFMVAGIFLAIWIVNKQQDPSYKIAWLVLILLIPLFGMMMYFFFSQRKPGKKFRSKALEVLCETDQYLEQEPTVFLEIEHQDESIARQSSYIKNSCCFPIYKDTSTKYFDMGEPFFEQLLSELKKAERYIFMEFFIVAKGYMWESVLEILKQKVQEGVEVRFMYDDVGCMNLLPRFYYKELRKMGIKSVAFNRLRPVLNSMFNNRDHRKIVVIDGHTAFVGGANLADEYINKIERFGVWKDSFLMMKGKAAWGFLIMFLQTWDFISETDSDIPSLKPSSEVQSSVVSDGYIQPFADSPLSTVNVSESVILNMISRAKQYIYFTTPYLILNDTLKTALISAALSGVDVRIMTPHIPDKSLVFLVTRSNYKELIHAGVRIFEYTPGFIHSKTCVCDDKIGMVGTINLDYRSMFLHFECAALLYQTSTIEDIKTDFVTTQQLCHEIQTEFIASQPWYIKLSQMVLRVFAPLF